MERKQVESGGGCEWEEEVCVFDKCKCDPVSQDLPEPTYTDLLSEPPYTDLLRSFFG